MTLWKKTADANSAPLFTTDAGTGETGTQEYGGELIFVVGNEGYPVGAGWVRRKIVGSRTYWETIVAI